MGRITWTEGAAAGYLSTDGGSTTAVEAFHDRRYASLSEEVFVGVTYCVHKCIPGTPGEKGCQRRWHGVAAHLST